MEYLNIEIKAKCKRFEVIRDTLKFRGAEFKGCDCQTDTYFNVSKGRLKLREGNIENCLVYYEREGISGPKQANAVIYPLVRPAGELKEILSRVLGVWARVEKTREIYFIENVKFHLDTVPEIGTFLEIEAFDGSGGAGKKKLEEQCRFYADLFQVRETDLLADSYSDMVLKNN